MSTERCENQIDRSAGRTDQRGSATLTAVLILGLLAVFTAAVLSRVTTEALVMGNDYSNTQAFYAAQASLELMSRSFNKVFDVQLRPSAADLTRIQNTKPVDADPLSPLNSFTFNQTITTNNLVESHPIDDGPFSGLISSRQPWQLRTVATYANGAQVQLTRLFYNHQIPIFQFGIFYNDDMELHPGPAFNFGGRVHSNGHIFMMCGNDGLFFKSRVTAAGEVIRDTARNGARAPATNGWQWGTYGAATWGTNRVWVANSAGVMQEVIRGSVVQAAGTQAAPNDDMPAWTVNPTWAADQIPFTGNLLSRTPQLRLPLQIGTNDDPIELVKRGIVGESGVLRDSRYYNKPGIRVSLSDSQGRLPAGIGGIRLDGAGDGLGGDSGSRAVPGDGTLGYEPVAMTGAAYQAKRINGSRFYRGANSAGAATVNRQTWIKVEIVTLDAALLPVATDVTADFLSMGMTYKNPIGLNIGDDRSILNMQRYEILGPPIKVTPANVQTNVMAQGDERTTNLPDGRPIVGGGTQGPLPAYSYYNNGAGFTVNFVATSERYRFFHPVGIPVGTPSPADVWKWRVKNAGIDPNVGTPEQSFAATLTPTLPILGPADKDKSTPLSPFEQPLPAAGGLDYRVVPFPIEMYSPREGLYNEELPAGDAGTPGSAAALSWWYLYSGTGAMPGTGTGTNSKVPVVGVVSVIDIDMKNLDRFLSGAFNTMFAGGLLSTAVPDNGGAGCIMYVSDRRGDRDNDGEYDMEDIYGPINGPNDGVLQVGEDVNKSGALNTDYADDNAGVYAAGTNIGGEAARYKVGIETDVAAVMDHKYFRRAVRVINGESANLALYGTLNRGYSIATENGLYTLGNFNCGTVADPEGILAAPAAGTFTDPVGYSGAEVPASLVADAITILSREWTDAKSFRNPFEKETRAVTAAGETGVRAALLMGDTKSSLKVAGVPNQGGGDADLAGGVHNFPRFLEAWGTRFNYCGSLINLFNSRQHDGAHKGGPAYGAPVRNWVFNTAFLDVNRLPPGTPFFQYIQMTGFRQTQRQIT